MSTPHPEGVLCARFKTLDPCGDFNLIGMDLDAATIHLDLVIPRAAIVGVVSHLLQLLLDPNVTLDLSVVLLLLHVLDVVSVVVIEANLTSSNNRG